ncbi:MAG TPA: hypothetical protein VKU89_04655 [Solirubrobacteraceae bacterium]|nr:hypothetical protein [Solirubrobacteraceae bacterium]
MSYRPGRLMLLRGYLNILIWRLPLPARVLARLSATAYRNPSFPASLVREVAQQLEAAGVEYWISGGWGLDALLGEQSRTHDDLDLVVVGAARAEAALSDLGFSLWYRSRSDAPMGARIVLRDHPVAGHAIDLHPIDSAQDQLSFSAGMIEGKSVPCLHVDAQIALHSGYRNANYRKRRRDRADAALLQRIAVSGERDGGGAGADEEVR